MSDTREFQNKFPEYDPSRPQFDPTGNKLHPNLEGPLLETVLTLLETLETELKAKIDRANFSVYTGVTGITLLYLHLADVRALEGKQDFLNCALGYLQPTLPILKKKRYSFLEGAPGALAVGSVLFHRLQMDMESKNLSQRLENLDKDVLSFGSNVPEELLYGKVGFLFSFLFLRRHIGQDDVQDQIIRQIIAAVLDSGKHLSKKFKNTSNIPLFFEWHDKAYVGTAHGIAGILYMLLQARDYLSPEDLMEYVKPSIDGVLALQFPSGNFPSSLENSTDRLVHWCHGAPGIIHLLLLAYQVFSEDKYLLAARQCGEVIWKRGLLKKGYGLCHGAAGNGYAFLRLYQVTKEEVQLHRALKFGEWCYDYGKHGCQKPDRPFSLFEGLAGTIYFLSDLLDPLKSAFPAFQLF